MIAYPQSTVGLHCSRFSMRLYVVQAPRCVVLGPAIDEPHRGIQCERAAKIATDADAYRAAVQHATSVWGIVPKPNEP